jgi:transposase-like protein
MTAQALSIKPRTWSAEERAEWVALFENSGQTALEFCRDNDLSPTTLAFWRSQRKDAATRPDLDEAAFVEVPLAALNSGAAPACAAVVTVRLVGGMQLEIVSGTDPAWLSQLLTALRG